jgi:hypothetical protein
MAVVEINLQRTRGGNDKLPALLVGMCATVLAGRHVVDVKDTTYLEWHLHILIDICQTPSRILFLGKIDDLAVV